MHSRSFPVNISHLSMRTGKEGCTKMAEKDVTQKILYDFADVFADIINVLLFDGEQRVLPEELKRAKTASTFRDDQDHLKWQERDVSKFWETAGVNLALLGVENQTAADRYMPARILSYDGAAYKDQLSRIKDKEDSLEKLFPVVTIVLHYGDTRWRRNKTLHECIGSSMLPELMPFVNDYKPYICDIAFLPRETIAKFRSDFGQVAKFFVDCREFGKKAVEKSMRLEDIRHVQEVIDLLSAFSGISKNQFVCGNKEGVIEMTSALQSMQEHWKEVGIQQGRQQGLQQGIQQEKDRALKERQDVLVRLLRAGVQEDLLLAAYPKEEILAAKQLMQ